MVKFIIRLVVNAVAIWIASLILSNVTLNGTFLEVLLVALIFGLANALIIRPLMRYYLGNLLHLRLESKI